MKIYTITLNPAYDVHAYAETFAPFHENLADVTSREAGGKGVNLSRALYNGGTAHTTIDAKSTIGAGDSTLAGFLAAANRGEDPACCLKSAVTYGTAACLTPGTMPPTPEDITAIYPQVQVKPL